MSQSAVGDHPVPGLDRLRAVMAALAQVGEHLDYQPSADAAEPDSAQRRRRLAAERIELISMLEWLKSAAAAAQARLTDAFARSQEPASKAPASTKADARRSVRAQIGLARRDSPHRASRHVNLAAVLVGQMPGVLAALARGETSEWRAQLIVQETRHLTTEQRAQVDAAIADKLVSWGDGQTQREARAWAHRLDPQGAADRAAKAAKDRRISIRPAPDCMTYLTALLPVKDGVACYAALHRHANLANATANDPRSRGQVMADELVSRILHPSSNAAQNADADATDQPTAPSGSLRREPVERAGHPETASTAGELDAKATEAETDNARMRASDRQDASGSASAAGEYGGDAGDPGRPGKPCAYAAAECEKRGAGETCADHHRQAVQPNPAKPDSAKPGQMEPPEPDQPEPGIMLHLVMTDRTLLDGDDEPAHLIGYGPLPAPLARTIANADRKTKVWIRRLYTDPHTGDLATTDARRRLFPYVARQFLITRDQLCRTPYCGAPIAHADHTTPAAATGPTRISNGAGRCQTCNYVKEEPGWTTTAAPDGTVTTRTPTGRRYPSRPPTPPTSAPWQTEQPLERTGTE